MADGEQEEIRMGIQYGRKPGGRELKASEQSSSVMPSAVGMAVVFSSEQKLWVPKSHNNDGKVSTIYPALATYQILC